MDLPPSRPLRASQVDPRHSPHPLSGVCRHILRFHHNGRALRAVRNNDVGPQPRMPFDDLRIFIAHVSAAHHFLQQCMPSTVLALDSAWREVVVILVSLFAAHYS